MITHGPLSNRASPPARLLLIGRNHSRCKNLAADNAYWASVSNRVAPTRSKTEMSRFLQALESRTLFAVDFVAAQAQVVADAVAARAALKSASAGIAAGIKMISADLRAA